jgi:hypothetical protein
MGINGGFDGGSLDSGSFDQFHLAVLGAINLSKAFNSSDEWLLQLSAERVLWAIVVVTNPLIEDRVCL